MINFIVYCFVPFWCCYFAGRLFFHFFPPEDEKKLNSTCNASLHHLDTAKMHLKQAQLHLELIDFSDREVKVFRESKRDARQRLAACHVNRASKNAPPHAAHDRAAL